MWTILTRCLLGALSVSDGTQYAKQNEISRSRYPCASKDYEGQAATVVTTADGGVLVIGTVKKPGKYKSSARVVQLSPSGQKTWSTELDNQDLKKKLHSFEGKCLIPMPDGNVIAYVNAYKYPGSGGKTWLVKLDQKGKILWQKMFRGSGSFNTPFAGRFSVRQDGTLAIEGHIYPERQDWKNEKPKVWRAIIDANGKAISEEERPWEERTF